ncbi:hypothetical protein PFY12_12975 [Chryseobacterium camelliae]|uniref:Response regulator n=1 Tax=Chryseobacterium camelliae TaxID=1265445 RepID=A0ABY7QML2_9FLAO|nr:hypothetical protein [Chryseobacterium camelliae]WBV59948.1 hypothetical protein PFY12_12975 [Chryseobacterium camelliae]
MNKEFLNVALFDSNVHHLIVLKKIFQEHRIKIRYTDFSNEEDFAIYLDKSVSGIPDVVFINYKDVYNADFRIVRSKISDIKYNAAICIVYADDLSDSEIDDILIAGANVFLKNNDDYSKLKKFVSEIIMMAWQYQTSGLNKSNFIMKIG